MSDAKALELAVRAVGLLPEVIKSLAAGSSEEDVRRVLRENREEMAANFDEAEARIRGR